MGILVTVTGRLTREPEQRQSQNGGSYALISVAGNEGYGEQQETYYFGASIYGKRAETVLTNYHKGDLVLLNGQYSEYQGNDGNTYKALRYATVEMLNHRNQPQQQANGWGQADTSWNATNNYNSVTGNQYGQPNNGYNNTPSNSPQNAPQGNLNNQWGNNQNQGQNASQTNLDGQNGVDESISDVPF
ncbi:single-stranded DNA-binding protein [Limosilactobacillus gastricus]|uniref:single-stranded DNA-binding protein n=1 Tax=Limosilactobacillus gastricus TaxID=227942 RepID=UPI0026F11C51|nr:single-stranded DNA-binding protein [Limosilactobacillus gastricus]